MSKQDRGPLIEPIRAENARIGVHYALPLAQANRDRAFFVFHSRFFGEIMFHVFSCFLLLIRSETTVAVFFLLVCDLHHRVPDLGRDSGQDSDLDSEQVIERDPELDLSITLQISLLLGQERVLPKFLSGVD